MFLFLLYYYSFLLRICAAICEGKPIIFRKKGSFGCFSTMVKKNFRSEKLFLFFYPLYCLHIPVNRFSWKPNKRWCSVKPYSLILIIGQWEIFILFALFNINVGVVPSLLMNKQLRVQLYFWSGGKWTPCSRHITWVEAYLSTVLLSYDSLLL